MPVSRPLSELEIITAEEYNGEYFSFAEWVRRRLELWAEKKTFHGTLYDRFIEYLSHDSLQTCESCNKVGEWLVSGFCVRCHKAICASCSRLHYRMTATICYTCYKQSAHEFLRDAKRSERRRKPIEQSSLSESTTSIGERTEGI